MQIEEKKRMNDRKILTIVRGEEFKLSLKEKIEESDIFYEQYLEAADMLDDIVVISENKEQIDWRKVEQENNIIAFCGERGEGKSSAMMTFINALIKQDDWNSNLIFDECENVKKIVFSKPVIIDPSTFDNVHNILEVIVATLYKEFRIRYDKDSSSFENDKCGELLESFQKVYRIISLLNNPEKMMEEEFDGEANISNLAKMGESTALKRELEKLVKIYLEYMICETGSKHRKLLIAIDDLDLCNGNAYKMAEQIRKYLIVPDIVIIMALKIEQLQMCIQEENFKNYRNVLNSGEKPSEFYEEVRNMAEKYITKLIPRSRRIYLPNVKYIYNAKIRYLDRKGKVIYEDKFLDSLNASLLNMIYIKTGMKFLLNLNSTTWLQANNLRDAVNMIILLGNMPEPEDDMDFEDNIETFSQYIEKEWIPQNFTMSESRELQTLMKLPYFQMNSEVIYLLQERYDHIKKKYEILKKDYNMGSSVCFFWIRKWLDDYRKNVYDRDAEKFSYVFHIFYTIHFNKFFRQRRYEELSHTMGGYIWGNDFNVMFPNAVHGNNVLNRSRFQLLTNTIYNTITERIGKIFEISSEKLNEKGGRISKIPENDSRKEYKMLTWMILGLFSNTFQVRNKNVLSTVNVLTLERIIYSNYTLMKNLNICMENYIVGLCDLGQIYDKVNMEMLGIKWEEYENFFINIENNNREKIAVFRMIFTNIDLIGEFYDYCLNYRDVKEGGEKDDHGRTVAVVNRFFRNVERFLIEYLDIRIREKLSELVVEDQQGQKRIIDISELYADLFLEYDKEWMKTNGKEQEKEKIEEDKSYEEIMKQLNESLLFTISPEEPVLSVSGYLINRTAQNAKANLDNLIHNIRRYYGINAEKNILELDTEELEKYYGEILKIYMMNPALPITKKLCEEYKQIVKKYNDIIKE